ncbi:small integral membrane protein 1-like [Dromiciops gliroides]|uniref:small integral membrane protein 1-like n=1 Tax=Dromiciops gliroides TaxID=33562 RepID=UPI001CC632FA|nr:small integral membrane protein 1-like [Dromiciops gliroides]
MIEPQESSVQYSRRSKSQDEVSMNMQVSESSGCEQIYTKLGTGKLSIAMKVAGGIIMFWIIFIIGYVTGYYIHKCK